MTPDETDVCVIGCGGTGSLAAYVLATAGVKVVALEAGPFWERGDYVPDEIESYAFENDLGPKWNREPVLWEDPTTGVAATGLGIHMMNGVGGSTLHYAAHAWRFHPSDFRLRSTVVERYGEGAIPDGSTVVDWPVDYEELEPYYDKVERAIGVSGKAGVLRDDSSPNGVRFEAGGNPFEGPRSREYPMPPLRHHRFGDLVTAAAERLGYHPFIAPTAINSVDYDGRPATNYCGFCLGYGCRIEAKGSPDVTVLPKALWTGNLEIVPEATVVSLETEGGRIVEARYLHRGDERTIRAKQFVLSSYVFENVRLLLNSAGPDAPHGVANGTGLVGRHFMAHRYDSVGVLFPADQPLHRFGGPQGQRVAIDDLNADNFDHTELGFIGGAQIFAPNEFHPIQDVGAMPPTRPAWGKSYKDFVRERWNNVGQLLTNGEVLPYEDNRLELDRSRRDGNGMPCMRAILSVHENERRMTEFVLDKMMEIGYEAGAEECWKAPTLLVPSQHDSGGTRMGESPADSVVDRWCRAHEVENLFILGPSVFPTCGGLNPSVTAQALAWRAAEHALSSL